MSRRADDLERGTQRVEELRYDGDGERKLFLVVLAPEGIREFDLSQPDTVTVGRSPSETVFIDDPSVSRKHARLTVDDDAVLVEDLGSTNGTFVNGERLGGAPAAVKPGDALRFGTVAASLHLAAAPRTPEARLVSASEFETRLEDEASRCMRFDRSLAVIAIDFASASEPAARAAEGIIRRSLSAVDYLTARRRGEVAVLVAETGKTQAIELARRVEALLAAEGVAARLGVAAFPGDAPSHETLLVAASLAMRSLAGAGVGIARESARLLAVGTREVVVAEPSMVRLFAFVERIANLEVPVLVVGETGTGKEIVAEALHALGPRRAKPLVKINCAALPENLLESELFGYEPGAFSGASASKPGLIEEGEGGLVLLDEIGEVPLALQAKLLRVIEDRAVRRLGAVKERRVDVRFVASTNRDLAALIKKGRFREDLYYRLAAVVVQVPPLRERRGEIPLLAQRFVGEAARAAGRSIVSLSASALQALEGYSWPGNVRQLAAVMTQAVVGSDADEIDRHHLPPEIGGGKVAPREAAAAATPAVPPSPDAKMSLGEEMRSIERRRILDALEACDGNQTEAARRLKMPRRTLVSKLAALGIEGPRGRRKPP